MHPPDRPDPLLQPDEAVDHILGPASAAVTLLEYGDFECPACAQAHPAVAMLRAHFGRRLRFVYRHFPQRDVHPHAELAAEAAEAAGAQRKFWAFHDMLFENPQHLQDKHLAGYASLVGLDMARYQFEMKDRVYLQRVQEHVQSGRRLGLRGTPAFYVNGVAADLSSGLQRLHEAIDRALASAS
ncbi:MAG: DsbA family protein [Polaromonas sp.]